jgi:hypothetical protein
MEKSMEKGEIRNVHVIYFSPSSFFFCASMAMCPAIARSISVSEEWYYKTSLSFLREMESLYAAGSVSHEALL